MRRPSLDLRAQPIDFPSAALGMTRRWYLYTPPGYEAGLPGLPVLYLFRGHEREWINRREDQTRGETTVIDVYEELLAARRVGPMILVFPGIASIDNHWTGALVNARAAGAKIVRGKLGSGRWEDYFLHELVPFVDRHYHSDPNARGVDGFSLGGFMAVKIAAQYPHLFRSAGAYDGSFFWDDRANPNLIVADDRLAAHRMFAPIWGEPPDLAFAATQNPMNLIRNGDAASLRRITWMIEYGPRSAEPYDSNYYRGRRVQALLRAHGIRNYGGTIANGHHTWQTADAHMRRTLPRHWRSLTGRRKP